MRSIIFKIGALSLCIAIIVYSLSGYSIVDIVIRSFLIFISVSIFTSIITLVILFYTQKIDKLESEKSNLKIKEKEENGMKHSLNSAIQQSVTGQISGNESKISEDEKFNSDIDQNNKDLG